MKKDNKILLRIDKSVCSCCGVATYRTVPENLPPICKNRCDLCTARAHNLNEHHLMWRSQ